MTVANYNSSSSSSAVERYKYLLSTSSPQDIEKAHEEAFASMTAEERQQVLSALAQNGETPADSSAQSLARSATRLEMKQPGKLSNVLGGTMSTGGTILTSLAAGFIGSAVFSTLTGGDGIGGRPGLLSRLFGMGNRGGYAPGGMGSFGGRPPMDDRGFGGPGRGGFGGGDFGGPGRGGFGGPGGGGRF